MPSISTFYGILIPMDEVELTRPLDQAVVPAHRRDGGRDAVRQAIQEDDVSVLE